MKSFVNRPFWAKSVSEADALEVVTPDGGDPYEIVHIFEAIPSYDQPTEGQPNKLERRTLANEANRRWKVKNSFSENMTIGQRIFLLPTDDGLCEILIWECGQDG